MFVQANDDPGSLSKTWLVQGNKFENNGNSDSDHQIYFQAVSDIGEQNIIEANYFGPPTPGQAMAQIKIRSTGTVVRYNWVNSAARTLDIVEAQDAIPNWMYDNYTSQQILDEYRTSYIYGNVFVNDHKVAASSPSTRPLHIGADSLDEPPVYTGGGSANGQNGMRGFGAPTYFFHNTNYYRADSAEVYRGTLLDLENNNSPGATSTPGKIVSINNIAQFKGNTRIGALNRSGTLTWEGANLLFTDELTIYAESDDYANFKNPGDDPNITIVDNDTRITGDANFVDAENLALLSKDFNLNAGSPAIGAAATLPAVLAAHPVQLQPANPALGGAVVREDASDLGALDYVPPPSDIHDTFDGSGGLDPGLWSQYGSPDISRLEITQNGGRYYADLKGDNDPQQTLWFNANEGRLDYVELSGDECGLNNTRSLLRAVGQHWTRFYLIGVPVCG